MTKEEDLRKMIRESMKEGYAGTGDSPYDQEFVDELYGKKKSESSKKPKNGKESIDSHDWSVTMSDDIIR